MLFDVFIMKALAAPCCFNKRVPDNFIKILPKGLNFHISWKDDMDTVLCILWFQLYNTKVTISSYFLQHMSLSRYGIVCFVDQNGK